MTSEGETIVCSECGETQPSNTLVIRKLRKIFCRECWTYHIGSRFRKRLFEFGRPEKGTSGQVFKPPEDVLIYYDGSPSSVALINLVRDALFVSKYPDNDTQNPRNIPFPFRFAILVILEDDWITGLGMVEKQKKHMKGLYKWVKETEAKLGTSFPLIATSIEMAVPNSLTRDKTYMKCERIGDDNWVAIKRKPKYPLPVEGEYPGPNVIGPLCRSTIEDLKIPFDVEANLLCYKILNSLQDSKTAQKDFINVLKSTLKVDAAKQLQVYKMILPEDQTALAIKMFSMMSLGRGSQIAEEMSFVSESNGVIFGRPLMDFTNEDLRQYLLCIPAESTEGMFQKHGSKSRKIKMDTIDRQCDEFIVELQRGYPGTVSTLTRIGGKLQPGSIVQPASYSNVTTDDEDSSPFCQFCKRLKEESDKIGLCYGCTRILRNMKQPEGLWNLIKYYQPNYIVQESTELQKEIAIELAERAKIHYNSIGTSTWFKNGQPVRIVKTQGRICKIIDDWRAPEYDPKEWGHTINIAKEEQANPTETTTTCDDK